MHDAMCSALQRCLGQPASHRCPLLDLLQVVRVVDPTTGIISAYAGDDQRCCSTNYYDNGPAINAGLAANKGISVDQSENMVSKRVRAGTTSVGCCCALGCRDGSP